MKKNFKYDNHIGDTLSKLKNRESKGGLEVIQKGVIKANKDLKPGSMVDEVSSKTSNTTHKIRLSDVISAVGHKQGYIGSDIQASLLYYIVAGWNLQDDQLPSQDPAKLDRIIYYLEL
ncbi:MAG: hypothetical protein KJI69_05040 [Patescibacteria group bacterium]|nr:hypothetical protein [Patescibacteria group bacterium]